MQKITVTNANNESLVFGPLPFGITSISGLSNAEVNIQEQTVPFHDGTVAIDQLINPREIDMTVALCAGNDLALRYQYHRDLINVLNTKLGPLTLTYENDYLSREITALVELPTFPNKNADDTEGSAKANLVFYCHSPFWRDTSDLTATVAAGNIAEIDLTSDVPVPFKVSIPSGAVNPKIRSIKTGEYIQYTGTVGARPLIINTDISEQPVTLKRYVIGSASTPYVIGQYGLVIGQTDKSVIANADPGSTMDMMLNPGINYIEFTTTSGSVTATITYRGQYVGV